MNDGYSFYPIVKILQLVHENIQMVHRDIKSDNIILTDIMVYVCLIDWLIDVWHSWIQRKRSKDMMVEYSLFIKTFSIKSDQTVTDGLLKSTMNLMMIILVYSMYVCMFVCTVL